MSTLRTRSLEKIEQRMAAAGGDPLRQQILQSAKNFKSSWIDLGQALYSVWKDKLYKEWGYMTFDTYTSKEIGIKKQTAVKLLKSYYFLEKEEPAYLKKDYAEAAEPSAIPSYEAVNVLRLAKDNKVLDSSDYASMRKNVFEMGKDAKEVKKDLTAIMKQREELEPDEARKIKRLSALKRFVSALKTVKREIEMSKLLPASILKEVDGLIRKVEAELD
jgi:hypothetical protein